MKVGFPCMEDRIALELNSGVESMTPTSTKRTAKVHRHQGSHLQPPEFHCRQSFSLVSVTDGTTSANEKQPAPPLNSVVCSVELGTRNADQGRLLDTSTFKTSESKLISHRVTHTGHRLAYVHITLKRMTKGWRWNVSPRICDANTFQAHFESTQCHTSRVNVLGTTHVAFVRPLFADLLKHGDAVGSHDLGVQTLADVCSTLHDA